ncbi:MAG TPA: YggT family protein [Candidatus Saccharimonadales bacterium]|nr:YggT family protein [Candidatus Saccharimonadales bacterium]
MEEKRETVSQETATGNVVTEKTTTQPAPEEKQAAATEKSVFQAYYLVYYITGLLIILLVFRFVFKLLGANPSSGFVSFIYSLTHPFLAPFSGIFHASTSAGAETTSVFDPAILIAIAVYGLIGWGIAKLLDVITAGKTPAA